MSKAPKKNKKPLVILAVLVLVIGSFIGFRVYQYTRPFRYAGTLEATKIDISAQVASRVQAVNVREGEPIKEGQELLQLSCDDVRIAAAIADDNFKRTSRLFKAGSASKEAFDQEKSRKDDAEVKLGWCNIRSPIQGKVLSRYHEPGEYVVPGVKLLTIANIKEIWAYVYVPQPLIATLKTGMKVTGHLPELDDRAFEGEIVKINDEAEFTPKNVQTRSERTRLVFGVKISFLAANQEEILKPGMTIEVLLPEK